MTDPVPVPPPSTPPPANLSTAARLRQRALERRDALKAEAAAKHQEALAKMREALIAAFLRDMEALADQGANVKDSMYRATVVGTFVCDQPGFGDLSAADRDALYADLKQWAQRPEHQFQWIEELEEHEGVQVDVDSSDEEDVKSHTLVTIGFFEPEQQ